MTEGHRGRARRAPVILLLIAFAVGPVAASPANEVPAAMHWPPPIASAGHDLDVRIVSRCMLICETTLATVHYTSSDGFERSASDKGEPVAGGLVTVTIPGQWVSACCYGVGLLTYWIEIRQGQVLDPGEAVIRLPRSGAYEVTILG